MADETPAKKSKTPKNAIAVSTKRPARKNSSLTDDEKAPRAERSAPRVAQEERGSC